MALVRGDGIEDIPCAAEIIHEGYIYKLDANYRATKTTAASNTVIGVAVMTSVDDTGAQKTLAAGQVMPFFILGCGKKVKVASVSGVTYRRGAPVFASGTAGMVTATPSNGAAIIGHYFGNDNLQTSADGELIDVVLDVPIGSVAP